MKVYRIACHSYGIRYMAKKGKRDLCGLTKFAFTNKAEALREYNALKQELKGCAYRMRLELVEVPDRLTIQDWIEFLETENISSIAVSEHLRIDTNRVAA